MVDRSTWLKERRKMAEYRYDAIFSRDYDEKYGRIDPTHRQFVKKLLSLSPAGCTVLDAACGTGKYWSMIRDSGRSVVGTDQSSEMLKLAAKKHPGVPTAKIGLQEMTYTDEFFAIMCVDAMENVPPEDWALVLGNFARALKSGGYLYFTVEVAEESEMQEAYRRAREMGLPVVRGEYAHHGGYHYYPRPEQVERWVAQSGLEIVEKSVGDGYLHYLVRKD